MKIWTAVALAASGLVLGPVAHAACAYPQAPSKLPNGAQATKEDMLAAQMQVKEYARSVQEDYLTCLQKEETDTIAALDPADPKLEEKKAAAQGIHAKKHNAALDELQALVDRWNGEKKAFQEKAGK